MTNDPTDIRAFLRLSPRITTSGAIGPADPPRLAAIGVRHVINLALADHPEILPDAAERWAAEGIRYTHIPVPFDAPGEVHFRAFASAMQEDANPVHVQCIMNWRVSAFMYRYHCETGMDEAEARGQMERIWSPEASDHPDAPRWAAFIRGEER